MKDWFINLSYWWEDKVERHGSTMLLFLSVVTVFSVVMAVVEYKYARELQGVIDTHIRHEEAEIRANERRRLQEEKMELERERVYKRIEQLRQKRDSSSNNGTTEKEVLIERDRLEELYFHDWEMDRIR